MTSSSSGRRKRREKTGNAREAEERTNKNRNKENSAIIVQEVKETQKEEVRKGKDSGKLSETTEAFLSFKESIETEVCRKYHIQQNDREAQLKYLLIKRQWNMQKKI